MASVCANVILGWFTGARGVQENVYSLKKNQRPAHRTYIVIIHGYSQRIERFIHVKIGGGESEKDRGGLSEVWNVHEFFRRVHKRSLKRNVQKKNQSSRRNTANKCVWIVVMRSYFVHRRVKRVVFPAITSFRRNVR